ncbi:MAG TPA: DUF4097 family beta strand repeat-containing protein [Micromonosporaceae bacterium]
MFRTRLEDDSSAPPGITEIRVTGGTGSVEVRPGGGSQVTIHRKVHYFKPFQPPPAATHHVEGDVLYLDTNEGTKFPFFVAVDYVVEAPPGVRVSGKLSSGKLRLTGVSGVDVRTSSGAIALTGVTGDITAKATSGAITGRELRSGHIDASTTSGRVSLDLAEPADVTAHASSGAITVTVPDGRYRVDTKVTSGRTTVGVPNDPTGEHHLDLRASSGAITVAQR